MSLLKKHPKPSRVFWLLQIIGWGLPSVLNSWGKFATGVELNPIYIIAEGLLFFTGGVLSTWVLRYNLKEYIDFNNFSKTNGKLVLLHYISAINIFAFTMFLAVPINIVINRPPHKIYHLMKINFFSTLLNIALYVFFWLVLYVAIKTIQHLRKAKIESLELQSELKEAQLNTLKGQINPHFMFNSLNNIRGLMLEDVNKSREMITRLSDMLRYSLNNNKVNTIKLKNEIEMVENYIALSKIQFEIRLDFELQMDKKLNNSTIPPMIIQMLIENAVKHGIANQTRGGVVNLIISRQANDLSIVVKNTGQLLSTSQSTQLGIKNIKKRLHLMYKDTAQFSLNQNENYVIATIKLPYHEE